MENILYKQFITVGAKDIRSELFIPVQRPNGYTSFKPRKGIWATEYKPKNEFICDWLTYLETNPDLAIWRFNKAVIFKLKDNSRICYIRNLDDIIRLSQEYPFLQYKFSYNGWKKLSERLSINYERLSDDFDAIYIDLTDIPEEMKVPQREFYSFDVNSLILSNTECIEHYQSVDMDLTDERKHFITSISELKRIPEKDSKYCELLTLIRDTVHKEITGFSRLANQTNYMEYIKELEDFISGIANDIFYKNLHEFDSLNPDLINSHPYPIIGIMSEIILSEEYRKSEDYAISRFLKK